MPGKAIGSKEERRELVTLGDAAESVASGIALGPHRLPVKNTAPYLRVANVQRGEIDTSDLAYIECEARDLPRYALTEGDVLVVEGHANPDQIGRAAIVTRNESGLLYQNHLFRVRFSEALPEFGVLWLNSNVVRAYWRSRCATSSGLHTINSKMLARLPFPAMGLAEQRGIVDAVAAVSRDIEVIERRLKKLKNSLRAISEDRLASLSKSAQTAPVGELLKRIEGGWSPACEPRAPTREEWGVIKLSAVTSGVFEEAEAKLLPADIAPRPELEIAAGDLLMSRANGVRALVGVSCHVTDTRERLLLSDLVFRLTLDRSRVIPHFVNMVFAFAPVRRQIDAAMRGTSGQFKISQADIRKLVVPVPDLPEQSDLVAAAAAVTHRIETLRARAEKLRIIRDVLAEDLLTGKVRVGDI